jgi:hypothetical protein
MEIVIDVARSGDGRLTGTARPTDSTSGPRGFAGVMELVACEEQLCEDHPSVASPPAICPQAGRQSTPSASPASMRAINSEERHD